MKSHIAWSVMCVAGLTAFAGAQPTTAFVNTLLPEPASLTVQQGGLVWNAEFSISTPGFHDARLDGAIQRTVRQLKDKTGTALSKQIPRTGAGGTLVVEVRSAGEAVQSVDEDESYTLSVSSSGAVLKAATVVGALRGLQTFTQLLQTTSSGFFIPAVAIEDTPRFRWRGLMIDCDVTSSRWR